MKRGLLPLGQMRHRVSLERSTQAPDGTRTTTPIATVWAAIEPVAAGEGDVGAHVTGLVTHQITVRWRADVTSADQLRLGARVFVPTSVVDPDETRRVLVIMAREEGR